mmetsp:Transcript_45195/g.141617  ORF Transcript_45195/g.141617 Transcript_45195/m.141617 type:complete len:274 (-) Transcript_45195:383-1204(-)
MISLGTGHQRFFSLWPKFICGRQLSAKSCRRARHMRSRASCRADASISGARACTNRVISGPKTFSTSRRYNSGMPSSSTSSAMWFRLLLSGVSRSGSPDACIKISRTASMLHVSGVTARSTDSLFQRSSEGSAPIQDSRSGFCGCVAKTIPVPPIFGGFRPSFIGLLERGGKAASPERLRDGLFLPLRNGLPCLIALILLEKPSSPDLALHDRRRAFCDMGGRDRTRLARFLKLPSRRRPFLTRDSWSEFVSSSARSEKYASPAPSAGSRDEP